VNGADDCSVARCEIVQKRRIERFSGQRREPGNAMQQLMQQRVMRDASRMA
jgi:hypothetical protein